jgi:hypothetical protein
MKTLKVTLSLLLISIFFFGFIQSDVKINGWFQAGSNPDNYTSGLDLNIFKSGHKSAFTTSKGEISEGFSTIMQYCDAKNYLGTKIKMIGYIKSENVKDWSGMWLRIDSKTQGESLGFDNMQDRPITGTSDWTRCEIIMDVPEESMTLNYGFLISGSGKIWFDNVSFEILNNATPVTVKDRIVLPVPAKPVNLDFEE